jgi:hypothetical protein
MRKLSARNFFLTQSINAAIMDMSLFAPLFKVDLLTFIKMRLVTNLKKIPTPNLIKILQVF